MSKVNADDLIVITPKELKDIKDSVAKVRGVDGTIAPKSFLNCLQTVNGAYSRGTIALEEKRYKIEGQMLLDWGNETRKAESSSADIPFTDLADRILKVFPIAYDKANDGDCLYKVNFSYNRFVNYWGNNIKNNTAIMEDYKLKIDNSDVGKAHRLVGALLPYPLENKTYTLEFEFFKEPSFGRQRVYFARGAFINSQTGGAMDGSLCTGVSDHLGFQMSHIIDTSSNSYFLSEYKFVENDNNFSSSNLILHTGRPSEVDENGELTAKIRVVLRCGAVKKNVTIYKGNGTIPKADVETWTVDVIPIYFTVYHRFGENYSIAAEGLIYHNAVQAGSPSSLIFGTGSYYQPTENQYHGIRNLTVYKGDVVNHTISFSINGKEYSVPRRTKWETFIDNHPELGLSYKSYDDGAEVYGESFGMEALLGLSQPVDGGALIPVFRYKQILGGNYAWRNSYKVTYKHTKPNYWYNVWDTGHMECYELRINGIAQDKLGAFENPAKEIYVVKGTPIEVACTWYDGGALYKSASVDIYENGESISDNSSNRPSGTHPYGSSEVFTYPEGDVNEVAYYKFNLSGNVTIDFRAKTNTPAIVNKEAYWDCYITTE